MNEIRDVVNNIPESNSASYVIPTENDVQEWNSIFTLFHRRSVDSCRSILDGFNYDLVQVVDSYTGDVYDVMRERMPVQRGWGTFIYNHSFKKKVIVHVTHPAEDWNTSVIGTELFRRTRGQWLMIAGTRKISGNEKTSSDIAKMKSSVFQRWHELLADPSTVTISVHGYNSALYGFPVTHTDVILSNGRTSDFQWGISQFSLSIRDSMNVAGIRCALTMYDSGYARFAGAGNVQGIFSNDNMGFGRWLNLELSDAVRSTSSKYLKVISTLDRILQITTKSVKQQNRAFALVSPRVVRIDSLRRMLFPPANDSYRIISFKASGKGRDSASMTFGNWLKFGDTKSMARVTALDTSSESLADEIQRLNQATSRLKTTRLIQRPASPVQSPERIAGTMISDSAASEDDPSAKEPLQVHKIPLQPVLLSTVSDEYATTSTPFRWEGTVNNLFIPGMQTFQMRMERTAMNEVRGIPNFLIPLMRSTYDSDNQKFVGVHMTSILVNEIARLVNEHDMNVDDVELFAEESETGDYYLRIFPNVPPGKEVVPNP